jgi:NAD-dependent SIR2 family protein deacetylase
MKYDRNDGCSSSECGAPWNEIDIIDEDTEEEETVCGCNSCKQQMIKKHLAEYGGDE